MAKKLDSYSSLTEFAPLSPDSKAEAFSIRQIFWKTKEKPDTDGQKALDPSLERSKPMNELDETSTFQSEKDVEIPHIDKNRGMSGILSKIMHNIVDKKKKGLQSYKDSDFKQYWMPDSNCKECYECGDKFTTFRRRHHCRVCGQIFCRRCCSQEIPGDLIGYTDDLRVCSYCCKTVLTCIQSLDATPPLDENVHSLLPNQTVGFCMNSPALSGTHSKQGAATSVRRRSSVIGFREEDIAKAKTLKPVLSGIASPSQITNKTEGQIQEKIQLKKLLSELLASVKSVSLWKQDYKDHDTKLIIGSDIVDWLMAHNPSLLRSDAVSIGQAFIDSELIECIMPQQTKFVDGNLLYKPLEVPSFDPKDHNLNEIQESMEPSWVKEIAPAESYIFKDSSSDLNKDPSETPVSPTAPRFTGSLSRFSSSNSMFYLDLDIKESRVSIYKNPNPDEKSKEQDISDNACDSRELLESNASTNSLHSLDKFINDTLNDNFMKALDKDNFESTLLKSVISSKKWQYSQLREDNGEKLAFEHLNLAYKCHEETLLNQLLSSEGLSLSWCDIILPIIYRVVNCVHPDVKNDGDDMDIRQYIQFKKIPGGNKSESSIVSGVVFSKTVAHKKMRQVIDKPTVLLLSSSISYQRVENKFSSLDPILMQEFEYLKNTIGKLTVFKPNILLVEKTVSRLAQEMLLALGITVVLNVKTSVMERIARGTQAAIVSTVDAHLGRPQLGSCEKFYVKSYPLNGGRSKTLMFFDGCPENLGCTILLRGGSGSELKKVKQVVQFMIYAAYNWHLERSFLMDEFAFLPSTGMTYADAKELDEESKSKSGEEDSNKSEGEILSGMEHASGNHKKPKSKPDEGRKLAAQSVSDFSDPLHSYLQEDTDTFQEFDFKVDKLPTTDTFKKLLNDIVLCCSLAVKIPIPFLETDSGKKCALRKFFPQEIYWSRHFTAQNSEFKILQEIDTQIDLDEENLCFKKNISKNVEMQNHHRFVSVKIVDFLNSSLEMQSMLSDFRARGGTIKYLCPHERSDREKEKKNVSESVFTEKEKSHQLVMNNNTGLCWEKKIDALDPNNHQTLAVLFSSYSCTSDNAPNYCVSPWVVNMEFYGSNDITLGGFLERYCFRSSYICPSASCVTPMTEHVRKFVHGSGCVHILLHELNTGLQASENNILMWSWCHKCLKATPVVSMSQDSWSFSFAKYLELRFYASDYKKRGAVEVCSHSLHHDHYQYFAQNKSVAIFKYTPVFIWDVAFPAFVIPVFDKALTVTSLVEKIKVIATKGHKIYSDVLDMLFALRKEYSNVSLEDFIDDMINMLKLEIPPFRAKIEDIQLELTSPTLESLNLNSSANVEQNKDVCNFMWKIDDQVVLLKYHIAEVVHVWNSRIQEFVSARKREQKILTRLTPQVSRTSEEDCVPKMEESQVEDKTIESPPVVSNSKDVVPKNFQSLHKNSSPLTMKLKSKCLGRSMSYESIFANILSPASSLTKSRSEEKVFPDMQDTKDGTHERKSSVFSCDSSYVYGVMPGIYAGVKAMDADDDESYIICHKDNQEKKVPKAFRQHHERSKSETEVHPNESFRNSAEKHGTADIIKPEKKTVMGRLSQYRSTSVENCLENPFAASEHLLLSQTPKIPVVVHEEEPSSLIAYTLACSEYEQKLQELKQNLSSTLNVSQKDSQASSPLLKHKPNRYLQEGTTHPESDDAFDFSADSIDKGRVKHFNKATNLHLEIQFADSTTHFYCRVYYAEQFRKLRSIIFPEGEERYIRSLSHCVQWMARGGKSGSMFCKTHDDRFILKQMPRLELQSFMDLAPAYIQYLNKAFLEQKPTLLAKIVGIYRIGFKNTATNAATKMDLLVMENLFYNCCVTKKYDLKGSIRNRLVNTNGVQEEDIVLLDENLLKITCDNPLYVRPHCKKVLTLAINNDSQFLADQSVMDYSLLVGLDEDKGELVVGIIDYIRTFTWDKKFEMLIKSSGILGGHGKLPTVISPELYKIRFCEAMDSYFLWVPDRWTGLGKGVDG